MGESGALGWRAGLAALVLGAGACYGLARLARSGGAAAAPRGTSGRGGACERRSGEARPGPARGGGRGGRAGGRRSGSRLFPQPSSGSGHAAFGAWKLRASSLPGRSRSAGSSAATESGVTSICLSPSKELFASLYVLLYICPVTHWFFKTLGNGFEYTFFESD